MALPLPPKAGAQTQAELSATALDAVTSTATGASRPLGGTPATVTAIDAVELERQNAVHYEPGVGVSNAPVRGGAGNFVIRGIGGNRVAQRDHATLSGGEQRRVQLARALAQLPDETTGGACLFLDDPTASLDLPHQQAVLAVAVAVARARRGTMVVLHDLLLAGRYCDRLLLLAGGRAPAEGRPEQVLEPGLVGRAYGLAVRRIADPQGGSPVIPPA